MRLGKQIRQEREKRGWTLEQLSERSGVDVGTISAIELRDSMRSQFFPALAKAFGLSLEDLANAATARTLGEETRAYKVTPTSLPETNEARTVARSVQALMRVAGVRTDLLGTIDEIEAIIKAELLHINAVKLPTPKATPTMENQDRHDSDSGSADLWLELQNEKNKTPSGKPGDAK